MQSLDKEVSDFCHKYDAVIEPSRRSFRRAKRVPLDVWMKEPDIFQQMPYEDIPTVSISMPEDRFRALLEHDDWISKAGLHDNSFFNNNVGRVAQMVVDMEKETRIRHENPAVRIAYEKYLMLLRTVYNYYE